VSATLAVDDTFQRLESFLVAVNQNLNMSTVHGHLISVFQQQLTGENALKNIANLNYYMHVL